MSRCIGLCEGGGAPTCSGDLVLGGLALSDDVPGVGVDEVVLEDLLLAPPIRRLGLLFTLLPEDLEVQDTALEF